MMNGAVRNVIDLELAKARRIEADQFAKARSIAMRRRETVDELVREGLIDPELLNPENPLDFVTQAAESLPDAAYRFCRAEPGIHVVLSGTGNTGHLEQNIASILRPPLPESVRARLLELFARVDTVSGQIG